MTTLNLPNVSPPPSVRRPWSERVNWRMIAFLAIAAAPFIYFLYVFMSPAVSWRGDRAFVDLRALGNFPFQADTGSVNDVPKEFRALDGKRVVLKGYMYATASAGQKGTSFQFVYDVNKCCFGGPPLVQERVFANAPAGTEVPMLGPYELAEVIGTLHVRVVRDKETGAATSVFDLDVERVKPMG